MDSGHVRMLQIFIKEGVLSYSDLKRELVHIFNEKRGDDLEFPPDAEDFLKVINDTISEYDMEIRMVVVREDGRFRSYYGIVQTSKDDIAKLWNSSNRDEQVFLKEILDALHTARAPGRLDVTSVLGLRPKKMNHVEAEKYLKKFCENKWLTMLDAEVIVGIRSRLNMRPYFRQLLEELSESGENSADFDIEASIEYVKEVLSCNQNIVISVDDNEMQGETQESVL